MKALSLLLVLAALAPTSAAADDETIGVILAVDGASAEGALASATDAGGAEWRLEMLRSTASPRREAPAAEVAAVESLYAQGDFPRCLTALTDPSLDVFQMLGDGHAEHARRLLLASAACTVAAGDTDRGAELFRLAFLLELDVAEALAQLRPDIAATAEDARRAVLRLERVAVTIDAPGATITVDGSPARCDRAPCVVRLYPGRHVIALEALGRSRRTERIEVLGPVELSPRLDVASTADARVQLAAALHDGLAADSLSFANAAADTFGARVLVVLQQGGRRLRATLYDRAIGEVVAQQSVDADAGAPGLLVGGVIDEWRGEVEAGVPWWVWAIVGGAALVAGTAAALLLEPELSTYSLSLAL